MMNLQNVIDMTKTIIIVEDIVEVLPLTNLRVIITFVTVIPKVDVAKVLENVSVLTTTITIVKKINHLNVAVKYVKKIINMMRVIK
jgi:hypothetical protein